MSKNIQMALVAFKTSQHPLQETVTLNLTKTNQKIRQTYLSLSREG